MKNIQVASFFVIGISVRTSNANGQAANDIGALWHRFMSENIATQIPNKVSDDILSIYTEYEGDYTKPYTTLLACKVAHLETVPEGMMAMEIKGGDYAQITATGNLNEGIVYKEWEKIWASDLNRAYTADYEVYGTSAQNPASAIVDIFIALK